MPTNWLASITPENWEILRRLNVWGVEAETLAERIRLGDRIIFYVTRTQPPSFMGIFEITSKWRKATELIWNDEKGAGEIIYPFRTDLKPIKLGTANVRELKEQLEFIVSKSNYQVYLIGSPANMKRPISDKDFQIIFNSLREEPPVIQAKTAEPPPALPRIPPSLKHNDIRDVVKKIGDLKSFIAETEHPMDALRVDAVWKTLPQAAPNWVFEVQIGGDLYEALTKLKHAYDIWNSRHLYLITTEDYIEQAEWLLSGAFHQIRRDARVVHWRRFAELFDLLGRVSNLEKELGLEGKR